MSQPPSDDRSEDKSGLLSFGAQLRMHRERAGLAQDRLGEKMGYVGSYIGNVERGERRCEREFAIAADVALGTRGALAHLWDREIKNAAFPSWFLDWTVYEQRATILRSVQLSVVDGLLQTPEYARALVSATETDARLARQSVLTRETPPPPLLVCVLDESVLLRKTGSREVMYDQLKHLVGMASDQVRVHVVPMEHHEGTWGSFILATLDDRSEVAYMDTAAEGLITGEPKKLKTMTESFEKIRSRALPVNQSIDIITRTAEERWT